MGGSAKILVFRGHRPTIRGMNKKRIKSVEPPVSWSKMVIDLNELGYHYSDLMAILGGAYHTYEKLKNGSMQMPRWDTGENLRRFYMKEMRTADRHCGARQHGSTWPAAVPGG